MKVINIFGGPGVGKTTISAGIFHKLKCEGYDVELVTEYAKDMVYEKRQNIMEDQIYVFAKQYRRISRLRGQVQFVVVDSPLLLGCAYTTDGYYENLEPLIVETFQSFDNVNFVLERPTNEMYKQHGRIQTHEEALEKDLRIEELLHKYKEQFNLVNTRKPDSVDYICSYLQ